MIYMHTPSCAWPAQQVLGTEVAVPSVNSAQGDASSVRLVKVPSTLPSLMPTLLHIIHNHVLSLTSQHHASLRRFNIDLLTATAVFAPQTVAGLTTADFSG